MIDNGLSFYGKGGEKVFVPIKKYSNYTERSHGLNEGDDSYVTSLHKTATDTRTHKLCYYDIINIFYQARTSCKKCEVIL